MATKKRQKLAPKKEKWQQIVLRILANGKTVTRACEVARTTRRNFYNHFNADPNFKKLCEDAIEQGTDAIEAALTESAIEGDPEPVIYKGEQMLQAVAADGTPRPPQHADIASYVPLTVRRKSITAAIFLLKGRRPEKYGDKIALTDPEAEKDTRPMMRKILKDPAALAAARALAAKLNEGGDGKAQSESAGQRPIASA